MIPKIDTTIGISIYSTKFPRVSGKIKSSSDDFFVSEVLSKKILDTISENDGFSVYILQKNGIDTTHALRDVEKRFGLVLNALGLKDSTAVTEQYVQTKTKSKSLEKIEGKISRMGALNLAAREEYSQEEERKLHLDKQHDELLSALEILQNAINKIDR